MKSVLLRCIDTDKFILPDGELADSLLLAERQAHGLGVDNDASSTAVNAGGWVLSVPAHKCLLTDVTVTKREIALLRKTLPWALEERLLEPAESQHFAVGTVRGETAAVCVINGAWLTAVLAGLSTAGIHPTTVVPQVLLLPWLAGEWSVAIDHEQGAETVCLIRFGESSGIACSWNNLHFVLQSLLNQTAETPEKISLFADSDSTTEALAHMPPLLQSRVATNSPVDWQHLANTHANMNLLQGPFAPRLPWRHWWQQWRLVAVLLLGLLVTDIVATALQTRKIQRMTAAVDTEIVDLFRSVQPEAAIVDPRLQLERAVATLGGSSHGGLTKLLERLAPALESSPAIQIQNLDYDSTSGELQLVIVSEGFTAAEELRAALQNLGLEAELLGSSSEGSSNRSRLRVMI